MGGCGGEACRGGAFLRLRPLRRGRRINDRLGADMPSGDRTIEDYDRLIARLEPMLRRCKVERKALVTRRMLQIQHKDPVFRAKLKAGRLATMRDPVKGPLWRAKQIENFASSPLPPMSPKEKRLYLKMRRHGALRDDALKVIFPYGVPEAARPGLDAPQTVESAPVGLPAQSVDRRTPVPVR